MNTFLTLAHIIHGKLVTWEFAVNTVDGRKYYFCRNHHGRTHGFANPNEQTRKIRRYLDIGYSKLNQTTNR